VLAVNPIIYAFSVFVIAGLNVFAGLHGVERYGFKSTAIFFVITWVVSLFFEALSIQTGFPFGLYHYNIPSLIIFHVPVIVIFAYSGTGYFSWVLSHVLTGRYSAKLAGKWVFIVPFIATFIMLMWDLGVDPISSTVLSRWVWQRPGPYFGVPIQNYVGWFLVGFIFYQLFSLYLAKYDWIRPQKVNVLASKPYWIEAAVVYGLIGLETILISVTIYNDITVSTALVTVFTMIFVAIISFIAITNNDELR
jgi:putative membrane protein